MSNHYPNVDYKLWKQENEPRRYGVLVDETEAKLQDDCQHAWTGHKDPNTAGGPGEYHEFCKHCGMERGEDGC